MKKLFLVGALAASMAFSSSALAAVNYGEANSIAATLNEDGTISVTTTLADETITSGQLTILVLDKDIDEVITNEETGETTKVTFDDSNIMYIDQASVTDNAVFENMGLLNPNEAETAYIRVGSDLGINIMTAELALVEEEGPTYLLGDVNMDTSINMGDAAAILNHFMGDAEITDATAKLAADVNVDTSINMGDAAAILNHFMGDALIVQPE